MLQTPPTNESNHASLTVEQVDVALERVELDVDGLDVQLATADDHRAVVATRRHLLLLRLKHLLVLAPLQRHQLLQEDGVTSADIT